jgi:hypothetical protein
VTLAALRDAITHRGPAKVSRLPKDVCARPYGAGIDASAIAVVLELAGEYIAQRAPALRTVLAEPEVKAYANPSR